MATGVEHWVRPEIRALSAYHVPEAAGLIKLDAMENPFPWPEELRAAWLERLRDVPLNRYPDPAGRELVARLREAMAIPADQAVLLGNGSDELIQIIALAVAGEGRSVLAPAPSFVMYEMIARFAGLDFVGVPLRADFSLDLPAMRAAIARHRPAVIFLAYPNNPTGNHWARADVEAVLDAAPGLVVVDEAYEPFADDSFMADLGRWPHLLVMRTLSKFGLAGLRLGYLCGPADWLSEFDKLRLPYNINVLTQVTAAFALEHKAVFDAQAEAIRAERARLAAALAALPGITVHPSAANFLLLRVPAGRANALHAGLRAAGVLVKNLSGAGGLLADCLRVTVGTPAENDALLAAFEALLTG